MSNNPASPADNNLAGISYLLAGVFVLTIMDVIAKFLVESDFSPFQILAIRGYIITSAFLIWTAARGQLVTLKTDRVKHHAVRGAIGFGAPFFFFTALGLMPLADVIVVTFAAPFVMTALSVPLLKETVGRYRWASIAVGFVGVVIVVQPGAGTLQTGALFALAACLSYSLVNIMTRWMAATESPIRLVFYFNLSTAVIGTCALPFVWKPMSVEDTLTIVALAAVAVLGHLLMTTAFTKAPLGVVTPFEYSALIWSTAFGFLIWGDFPAENVWLGAGIIVASGLYMIHREAVNRRKSHMPS